MNKPNDLRLLRIKEVSKITSLAKSTISLWVAQGRFPSPTKLSPTIKVWRAVDIDSWVSNYYPEPTPERDQHEG
jgi:prophage regulatory protein